MNADILASLSERKAWILAPLAGIEAGHQYKIGPALISGITFANWLLIERRQITDEYEPLVSNNDLRVIYAIFSVPDGTDRNEAWDIIDQKIDVISAALWLAGVHTLIDPRTVCLYYRSGGLRRKDSGLTERRPGQFRMAMYEKMFPSSMLSQEAVTTADNLVPVIERWLEVVDGEDRIAFNLFRHSYTPGLGNRDRLLFIFAAIESLFYSWRDNILGTSLDQRLHLAIALRPAPMTDIVDVTIMRRIRNELAHGAPEGERYLQLLKPIRDVFRSAFMAWVRYCLSVTTSVSSSRRHEFNHRLASSIAVNESLTQSRARMFGSGALSDG